MSIDDKNLSLDKESFNKNYEILKEIAARLENQAEPDIDALVPMVEKATKAYQICQERLDKAEAALKKHLPVNTKKDDKNADKSTADHSKEISDDPSPDEDIPF